MHVEPVLNGLRAALANQGALAGGDPAVDAAVTALIDALGPALHLAAFELAQQAAAELGAQLADRTVEVVVSDGDPALRVTDVVASKSDASTEDFDARITLRLPPSLKNLIENSATLDGDSVNAWVVDALAKHAKQPTARGRHVTDRARRSCRSSRGGPRFGSPRNTKRRSFSVQRHSTGDSSFTDRMVADKPRTRTW